jgi:multidrug efflux pump subunit AcrA (membrane-fusion protein)
VQAVIAPATPLEGAGNGAAVKVTLTQEGLTGVLLVPTAALASRLDGTYAIEIAQPDGTGVWTPVEVLGMAGGNVAVKGEGIVDGTEVLRPV